MCNHHLHTTPCSLRWPQSHLLRFLYNLTALFLVAGLVLGPASASVVQAGSLGDVESEMYMSSCYGVYHIVRPGQTLYSIAAAYGTTAYRIAVCNGISSYRVYVGQALLVPTYRSR